MKIYAARQSFTLVVLLALMLYVPLSPAADGESLSVMDWPLQPGESIRDLSVLIYPKSQHMQQYFTAETIKLNVETQPDLEAATVFEQEHQIRIPSIKALSRKSAARIKHAQSEKAY